MTEIGPDEGPMLETLDYTIRIGSTPTLLYYIKKIVISKHPTYHWDYCSYKCPNFVEKCHRKNLQS